jgi:hypothetical protein
MEIHELRDEFRAQQKNPLARAVLTSTTDGVEASMTVSPCSWMYPGYPLQVEVVIACGGTKGYITEPSLKFQETTTADLERLFGQVRYLPCAAPGCSNHRFDPNTVQTGSTDLCHACAFEAMKKELAAAQLEEKERFAELDREHKEKGFTHRVDAWIHPASGSDHEISFYISTPTKRAIRAEVRKSGCTSGDDYTLVEL